MKQTDQERQQEEFENTLKMFMGSVSKQIKNDPKLEYLEVTSKEINKRLNKAAEFLFKEAVAVALEVAISGYYQKPYCEVTESEIKQFKSDPEHSIDMLAATGRYGMMVLHMLISNIDRQLAHTERMGIFGMINKDEIQKRFKQKDDNKQ